MNIPPRFRFSGHESFPCRYAWIPKGYRAIQADPHLFADEDHAMSVLGVGKNMVRSIRFWLQAFGVARPREDGGWEPTEFGRTVFADGGYDPFLEDIRTLWLLHWKLCLNVEEPLFAWEYLMNRWPHPEISRSEVLRKFEHEADRLGRKLSTSTLEQHFTVFLHTYVPTRGTKGEVQEDNLDCPLVELSLIQQIGERRIGSQGKTEAIYAFCRDRKPAVTPALFVYCVGDFWNTCRRAELTLSFRDLSVFPNSPGQVFKLTELDLRERLDRLNRDSGGRFEFQDSAAVPQLTHEQGDGRDLLAMVYRTEGTNVAR